MKIRTEELICPKCKEKFKNQYLMSFYSGMANAANRFQKNNKVITKCPKCKLDLVNSDYAENFDENGNLSFGDWTESLHDVNLRLFINYDLYKLKDIIRDLNVKKIIIDGIVEVVDSTESDEKKIINYLVLKLVIKNQEYKYLKFSLLKNNYLPDGDTCVYNYMNYNSFYYKYFEKFNLALAETFKDTLKCDLGITTKIEIRLKNLELDK